ncbi:unnamed protein product [Orchesella dallaii]|uniref:Uncharacterized protein n=1 Tax=Orchesella dallaii TaxID=48710 RepID=A0ABP1SAL9_9HEXA
MEQIEEIAGPSTTMPPPREIPVGLVADIRSVVLHREARDKIPPPVPTYSWADTEPSRLDLNSLADSDFICPSSSTSVVSPPTKRSKKKETTTTRRLTKVDKKPIKLRSARKPNEGAQKQALRSTLQDSKLSEELENANKKLEELLQEKDAKISNLEEENQSLKQENKNLKEEIEYVKIKKGKQAALFKAVKNYREVLVKENIDLKNKMKETEEKFTAAEVKFTAAEEKFTALEEKLAATDLKYKKNKQEFGRMKRVAKKLNNKNIALKIEYGGGGDAIVNTSNAEDRKNFKIPVTRPEYPASEDHEAIWDFPVFDFICSWMRRSKVSGDCLFTLWSQTVNLSPLPMSSESKSNFRILWYSQSDLTAIVTGDRTSFGLIVGQEYKRPTTADQSTPPSSLTESTPTTSRSSASASFAQAVRTIIYSPSTRTTNPSSNVTLSQTSYSQTAAPHAQVLANEISDPNDHSDVKDTESSREPTPGPSVYVTCPPGFPTTSSNSLISAVYDPTSTFPTNPSTNTYPSNSNNTATEDTTTEDDEESEVTVVSAPPSSTSRNRTTSADPVAAPCRYKYKTPVGYRTGNAFRESFSSHQGNRTPTRRPQHCCTPRDSAVFPSAPPTSFHLNTAYTEEIQASTSDTTISDLRHIPPLSNLFPTRTHRTGTTPPEPFCYISDPPTRPPTPLPPPERTLRPPRTIPLICRNRH